VKVVFVDMDEVLCDFVGAACRALGRERPDPWPVGAWSIQFALGLESSSEMWKACRPHHQFFAGLDWMPDGREIWETVRELVDPARVFLLSTPSREPGSWSGKIEWVRRHIGEGQVARTILCEKKRLLASSGSILFDDRPETVREWCELLNGAMGVLIPRPNNRGSGNPVEVVREALVAWHNDEPVATGLEALGLAWRQ